MKKQVINPNLFLPLVSGVKKWPKTRFFNAENDLVSAKRLQNFRESCIEGFYTRRNKFQTNNFTPKSLFPKIAGQKKMSINDLVSNFYTKVKRFNVVQGVKPCRW